MQKYEQTDSIMNRQTDQNMNRQTDRYSHGQTDKQTSSTHKHVYRQTDSRTDRLVDRHNIDSQRVSQTVRQSDRQTDGQTDRPIYSQPETQTDRYKWRYWSDINIFLNAPSNVGQLEKTPCS